MIQAQEELNNLLERIVACTEKKLDISQIKKDIDNNFESIRKYLNHKYPVYENDRECRSFKTLAIGWVPIIPGSAEFDGVEEIQDYYIKMSKNYIEYIDEKCDQMEEKYEKLISDFVEKEIYTAIRIDVSTTFQKLGIQLDRMPIKPFDFYDYIPNEIFECPFVPISDLKVDYRFKYGERQMRIEKEYIDLFWKDMITALNMYITNAKKTMERIFVYDLNNTFKEYARVSLKDLGLLIDKVKKENANVTKEYDKTEDETLWKIYEQIENNAIRYRNNEIDYDTYIKSKKMFMQNIMLLTS